MGSPSAIRVTSLNWYKAGILPAAGLRTVKTSSLINTLTMRCKPEDDRSEIRLHMYDFVKMGDSKIASNKGTPYGEFVNFLTTDFSSVCSFTMAVARRLFSPACTTFCIFLSTTFFKKWATSHMCPKVS